MSEGRMTAEQTPDIEAVLAEHRPSDDRSDRNTPVCSCGHDLGWLETWPQHVAQALAARLAARTSTATDATAAPTTDTGARVLLTEPHDGHAANETCPGCPHTGARDE